MTQPLPSSLPPFIPDISWKIIRSHRFPLVVLVWSVALGFTSEHALDKCVVVSSTMTLICCSPQTNVLAGDLYKELGFPVAMAALLIMTEAYSTGPYSVKEVPRWSSVIAMFVISSISLWGYTQLFLLLPLFSAGCFTWPCSFCPIFAPQYSFHSWLPPQYLC